MGWSGRRWAQNCYPKYLNLELKCWRLRGLPVSALAARVHMKAARRLEFSHSSGYSGLGGGTALSGRRSKKKDFFGGISIFNKAKTEINNSLASSSQAKFSHQCERSHSIPRAKRFCHHVADKSCGFTIHLT